MFNVHDPSCGKTMLVYRGNVPPAAGTPLVWSDWQHLDGSAIDPAQPARCDSCGGPLNLDVLLDPSMFAIDWVRVAPATFGDVARAHPTYHEPGR